MKNFMPVFIFLFFSLGANAQQKKIAPQWLNLTGIVADSNSSMRIAGATIEISIRPGDPSQKKQSSFPNKIAITNSAGDFEIDHIPIARSIYLSVSAIGYKTVFKKIIVSPPDRNYLTLAVNAGVIKLAKEYKSLDAVVVSSKTKSLLELQNDKRVFLADKAIVSQGGTAIDLFRTIPSVSVDADGAVTMRSASPQILVDGRPSFLTPDQIPADMIEKVELITNPSARYDASSSGGVI
ncbi:MAG: TonB-dependent receptor plug domain-containing protein, partial [Bacteroidetes bacterium]|nr:TonB-dependent receptor plug domain-containing protein [Bacteroidota bacterium]